MPITKELLAYGETHREALFSAISASAEAETEKGCDPLAVVLTNECRIEVPRRLGATTLEQLIELLEWA